MCDVASGVAASPLARPDVVCPGSLARKGCRDDHDHGKRTGCERHKFEHRLAPYIALRSPREADLTEKRRQMLMPRAARSMSEPGPYRPKNPLTP